MTVSNGFMDGLCEIMPVKSMKFWKRSLSALYVHITTVWITGYHKVKNRLREAEYMPTSRQQCWDASPMTTETQNRALKKAEVYDKWYIQLLLPLLN